MHTKGQWDTIRAEWLICASEHLAQGEGVREGSIEHLDHFFDLLVASIETEDPAVLDPLLDQWLTDRTESEIERVESSIVPVLSQIFMATLNTISKIIDAADVFAFIRILFIIYTHAIEYSTFQETKLYAQYATKELDKAKVSLEKLEKSKTDFISVAAHELKTPLTLIEGYASMIDEIVPSGISQEPIDVYLRGIKSGTRRLRDIVDDMIDVSLIDNNLLSLNFQPVWINRLLNLVTRELKQSILERRLTITIEDFPGSNEMIFGDGERLYQAFRNVIMNAVKFTPDGGSITISGRTLPGFIETVISDTGIGIDPQEHNRIFERFGRIGDVALHSSGKIKFKGGGPGLGLSITKGIIESHGGTIWVESQGYDEINCPGSTFHIFLPIRKSLPDDQSGKLFPSGSNG